MPDLDSQQMDAAAMVVARKVVSAIAKRLRWRAESVTNEPPTRSQLVEWAEALDAAARLIELNEGRRS